jgi:hypothetical protein
VKAMKMNKKKTKKCAKVVKIMRMTPEERVSKFEKKLQKLITKYEISPEHPASQYLMEKNMPAKHTWDCGCGWCEIKRFEEDKPTLAMEVKQFEDDHVVSIEVEKSNKVKNAKEELEDMEVEAGTYNPEAKIIIGKHTIFSADRPE